MKKLIKNRDESRERVLNAMRLITEPVVGTLGPLGGNVLYEDSKGQLNLTNDGVTIAKQISSDDPVENAIIEVIKHGALKTNSIAGDGTTTTTLFTNVLIKEGMKLIEDGINPMILKDDLDIIGEKIVEALNPIKIKDDKQLRQIASISANNDDDIADNVVDVVKTAGEDGIVLIQDSPKEETIVEKNSGFIIDGGMISPEYSQNNGFTSTFEDGHVLVCDKRIYYEEEAETILRVAIENGITKLTIVARDFIGKAVNVFSANHLNNEAIELILVKDTNATEADNSSLQDLAVYLNGTLITDKAGKLVNNLKEDDFCEAKTVFANPQRTVLTTTDPENPELIERVKSLKDEKEKGEEDSEVKRRLAALTNGMVTVRVGGSTPIEVQERIFRYEDAINATRAAMKDGYLAGGGLGILSAYVTEDYPLIYQNIARKLCEASVRQLAMNCGKHDEFILSKTKPYVWYGYNAKTDKFEDLIEAGVIDPYKVTEMAVKNAVSIAGSVLSAQWIIVNEKDDDKI